MNVEQFRRAQEIFLAAQRITAAERGAWLDGECGDDPELRRTVEGMLEVESADNSFLGTSPFVRGSSSDIQRTRVKQLVERSNAGGRLVVEKEVARGGMGAILKVRDTVLHRTLAMKVIHGQKGASSTGEVPGISREMVARFLDEAQVTGQLEHPGIVPVHEMGVDPEGRIFFTMPLVRGRTLGDVLERVAAGDTGWTPSRVLAILQKVCETMAYAHDSGVVHRDLKPANIMIGDYGEVYVMDWGLARARGQENPRDVRPEVPDDADRTRALERDGALRTMDGAVLGTPSYMSPEQAAGDGDRIDAASDIYAIGSILYQLLIGAAPYRDASDGSAASKVLAALRMGPPTPITDLAPKTPPELVAIAERAMARRPADRYADMGAFARDFESYLDGRVVQAHRTGAWVELKKWIGRNRIVATAASVAIAGILLGSIGMASAAQNAAALAEESEQNAKDMATAERNAADLAREAERRMTSFQLFFLEEEEESLWPAIPARIPAMEQWIADAERVIPLVDGAIAALTGEPEIVEARAERMRAAKGRIEALVVEVRQRRDRAFEIERKTITDATAREAWDEAIAAIDASPLYQSAGGFHLEPQVGLLPIDVNPRTGLWEFLLYGSGEPPLPNPNWNREWIGPESPGDPNRWLVAEQSPAPTRGNRHPAPTTGTGIVLVLLPPQNDFLFGGQGSDPDGPNYDFIFRNEGRRGTGDEKLQAIMAPVRLDVSPFFIAKYEITQGQWLRSYGENPSVAFPGQSRRPDVEVTWEHPVNHLNGEHVLRELPKLGLRVPTEEEWEYATRGGTTSVWWPGPWAEDAQFPASVAQGTGNMLWQARFEYDDGFVSTSPVGSFRANPFGLHDVYGNVAELCIPREPYLQSFDEPGALEEPYPIAVYRGGSFDAPPARCTSAAGIVRPFLQRRETVGIRPVRLLDGQEE